LREISSAFDAEADTRVTLVGVKAWGFESHREEPHPGFFLEENLEQFPDHSEQSVPASEMFLPEILAPQGYHSITLGK
jgi:hypothetical protein